MRNNQEYYEATTKSEFFLTLAKILIRPCLSSIKLSDWESMVENVNKH